MNARNVMNELTHGDPTPVASFEDLEISFPNVVSSMESSYRERGMMHLLDEKRRNSSDYLAWVWPSGMVLVVSKDAGFDFDVSIPEFEGTDRHGWISSKDLECELAEALLALREA